MTRSQIMDTNLSQSVENNLTVRPFVRFFLHDLILFVMIDIKYTLKYVHFYFPVSFDHFQFLSTLAQKRVKICKNLEV